MNDPFFRTDASILGGTTMDMGLRAYMQRVFAYMGGGLAVTGLIAWGVAQSSLAPLLLGSGLRWVFAFAPFIFIMVMSLRMQTISRPALQGLFWLFCATMGVSMASVFLTYTDASIGRAFFVAAGMFGAMGLWGYTTKKDLAGMGAFMMMGLIGLILASLVNFLVGSGMLAWLTSVMGVVVFTGLTAWNMQNIKQTYSESHGAEANDKLAVFGALSLYLSFINLFYSLMSLMGDRR